MRGASSNGVSCLRNILKDDILLEQNGMYEVLVERRRFIQLFF